MSIENHESLGGMARQSRSMIFSEERVWRIAAGEEDAFVIDGCNFVPGSGERDVEFHKGKLHDILSIRGELSDSPLDIHATLIFVLPGPLAKKVYELRHKEPVVHAAVTLSWPVYKH